MNTTPHPHAATLAGLLLAVADDPAAVDRTVELIEGDPTEVERIIRPGEPEPSEGDGDG